MIDVATGEAGKRETDEVDDVDQLCRALRADGFAVLPAVLPPPEVAALVALADRRFPLAAAPDGYVHEFDFVVRERGFLGLVDVPVVLAVVTRMLGANVHVYHSHLDVTGRNCATPASFRYRWHQDAGQAVLDLGGPTAPLLSVKAGFVLSDATEPGTGAPVVVPGSHRAPPPDEGAMRRHGTPLLVPAGSCVLFDNRLWHSRGPLAVDRPRHAAFVAYAPRWVRPRDRLAPPPRDGLTARQAWLLGCGDDARAFHVEPAPPAGAAAW